ncbi:penicillin-binding protein 2 [candidate division WOR-3 bacterium]|nr:penicillin-binding protein 2 [candidate division WOR-3 bacterium]
MARIKFATGVFSLLAVGVLGYAFYLQVILGPRFAERARSQHEEHIELLPRRGKIYDRNGIALVTDEKAASVFVLPQYVEDIPKAVEILAARQLGTPTRLERYLRTRKKFFWLARKLDYEKACALKQELEEARLTNAINIEEEARRIYPWDEITGSIVGFVGREHTGLAGIEFSLDSLLAGTSGWAIYLRDALGREHPSPAYPVQDAEDGCDVTLTIDLDIQAIAFEELKAACQEFEAKRGYCVVMHPQTGEILALVDYPDFAPAEYSRYPKETWKVGSVADEFEPGSVYKAVVAAICLEDSLALRDEWIPTGGGIVVQGRTITDVHGRDGYTFDDVFIKSSNIGAAKLALRCGATRFYEVSRLLGVGSPTGIELPGEGAGKLDRPSQMTELRLTNNAFGQGLSLTTLQLAVVYSAFASGGVYNAPWIIKRVDRDGRTIFKGKNSELRRVFSEETAQNVCEILYKVIEEGTGKAAKIKGIEACGKTGTAQKPVPGVGYSSSLSVVSFVGFLPREDPKLLTVVVVDEPGKGRFAGEIAAPVFQRIMERTLRLPEYREIRMRSLEEPEQLACDKVKDSEIE